MSTTFSVTDPIQRALLEDMGSLSDHASFSTARGAGR
jgi:hypothetical protein